MGTFRELRSILPHIFIICNSVRTITDRWDKYFYENCKEAEKKYLDIIDNNFKAVREVQEVRCFISSINRREKSVIYLSFLL